MESSKDVEDEGEPKVYHWVDCPYRLLKGYIASITSIHTVRKRREEEWRSEREGVCVCVCVCKHMCACVCMRACVRAYVCVRTYVCAYVRTCVRVTVCMCVCVCVCVIGGDMEGGSLVHGRW